MNSSKEKVVYILCLGVDSDGLTAIHFYADWLQECTHMNLILDRLTSDPKYNDVTFAKCHAENSPEISREYDITSVPTFVFTKKGQIINKFNGADPRTFLSKLTELTEQIQGSDKGEIDINTRLKTLINSSPVMLFMKGDAQNPRCGFSKQIIALMDQLGCAYKTFDILQDEDVRSGLKVYSNWPTYPQLYINGNLIGGLDIVKEMNDSGDLKELIQSIDEPKKMRDLRILANNKLLYNIMNFEDYETLPTFCVTTNMTAGALAGIMEHCVMYPVDSVKTRMQSLVPTANGSYYRGIGEAFSEMVTKEGALRPMRGMGVVIMGAGPAHALYFSSYEYIRDVVAQRSFLNTTLASGVAGSVSTVLHDSIMTPTDVVKQRLQMLNSPYKTVIECIGRIYHTEGLKAFYRSYTTQLLMNLPFQSLHFMTYEFCQNVTNKERCYNPVAHMVSGAVAGGIAASVTTPLDVCKTLINTQHPQMKITGLLSAIRMVYRLGGPFGYFRGLSARVLFQMPSTAICWSTYEFFKYALTNQQVGNEAVEVDYSNEKNQWHIDSRDINTNSISCNSNKNHDDKANNKNNVNDNNSDIHPEPSSYASKSPSSFLTKSCELPVMSSSSIFNALSLSTLHSNDSVTTSTLMDATRR